MKKQITEKIEIPQGIICDIKDKTITVSGNSNSLNREISNPHISAIVEGNYIVFKCAGGNKINYKTIKSYAAHVKNMFEGVKAPYTYVLESCNVHFPMTLKVDQERLTINNFLGEKVPRHARIISGVKVDVKGQKITISSSNKEAAGQTAANIEKATKVRNRDRRVFQDGIYIVEKPGGKY